MTVMIALSCLAVAIGAGAVWVLRVADSAPNLSALTPRQPNAPTEIDAVDGTLLGYVHSDVVCDYVPPDRIPQTLKQATVAIEDRRFWRHGALDYQSIVRAAAKDLSGRRPTLQGASTLTMQLVDNLYMPNTYRRHHDLKYKIVQAKLAEQLERTHSKDWILNAYVNDVPYGTVNGETAQGVGAAAQMFFGKPVWELSLAQQATLAGLPQSPTDYNPLYATDLALARRNTVLEAMVRSGYITERQARAAEHETLVTKRGHGPPLGSCQGPSVTSHGHTHPRRTGRSCLARRCVDQRTAATGRLAGCRLAVGLPRFCDDLEVFARRPAVL